jgi:hypothetical protein
MPNQLTATTEDIRVVVRQLKFLVVVLILSNIALGAFGFFLLRDIDRNYTGLIDQAIPTLTKLQNLTVAASDTMRSTNPILLEQPNVHVSEVARAARGAVERDAELRRDLLSRDWVKGAEFEQSDIRAAGEAFDQAAIDTIRLLETNDIPEVTKQREAVLRPAYNRYVAATTRTSELLHSSSLKASDSLTLRVNNFSKMILGFASWPLLILGVFLLFTALFVIGVLVKVALFKEKTA